MESSSAFASFEQKWLDANPEQTIVALFLKPAERLRVAAFGSLIYELEQTAFSQRDLRVAEIKLAWWRQELLGAASGNPRHPISVALFADPHTANVGVGIWATLVDGAAAMLSMPFAENFNNQFVNYNALYTSVAQIESTLFETTDAEDDAIAKLAAISQWLRMLHRVHDVDVNLPIPLDFFARHGLTRVELSRPNTPRSNVLLRDYLTAISKELQHAISRSAHASLARRMLAKIDLAAIEAASRADDPLASLHQSTGMARWKTLWWTWREARKGASGATAD